MRSLPLLALPAVVLAAAGCGGGDAKPTPPEQVSTFKAPDPAKWTVTDHPLGRGTFQTANVSFTPAGLDLKLPAGTLNGGELQHKTFVGDGRQAAQLKTAGSPGSISAFFLYRHDFTTDSSDELDFEIPGTPPFRVLLTVWRKGIKTPVAQKEIPLGFDPSKLIHDYAFVRAGAKATFQIDGNDAFSYDQAPTTTMRPIFNAWYPQWQEPAVPPQEGTMTVRRYGFQPPS